MIRETAFAAESAATLVAPVEQARAAIERSLPFIEKVGSEWIKNHDCNSCHVVAFQVWSHSAAAAHRTGT